MVESTSTKYIWQHAGLYIMNYIIASARRRWCVERACEDTEMDTSQTTQDTNELGLRVLTQQLASVEYGEQSNRPRVRVMESAYNSSCVNLTA